MVVGKVSNAVVHPHKLDKPALAVVDEAPTAVAAAPAEELKPIGPLLAKANVEAGKANHTKLCLTLPTHDKAGPHQVGPHHWNTVYPNNVSPEGFSDCSAPQANRAEWTDEELNH